MKSVPFVGSGPGSGREPEPIPFQGVIRNEAARRGKGKGGVTQNLQLPLTDAQPSCSGRTVSAVSVPSRIIAPRGGVWQPALRGESNPHSRVLRLVFLIS